jgi:transcriptional regulator with XRE-family HTH domain
VPADAAREIAARLRNARDQAGLTQGQVAAALNISQPSVSALEAGTRPIRIDELVAIARLISIDPSDFLRGLSESDEAIGVTLRAEAASLPFAELRGAVTSFVDDLQGQPFPLPLVAVESTHPEAAASDARAFTGHNDPPIDVRAVANSLGVAVATRPFPNALSALIVRHGANAAIGVNSDQAPVRQRFSIAHELGHFVLHHDDQHFIEYGVAPSVEGESPGYSWQHEQEANRFAAELLMPADRMADDAKRLSLSRLARRYQVSEAAMGFRLANLGLRERARG